jgi:hypothetical protein
MIVAQAEAVTQIGEFGGVKGRGENQHEQPESGKPEQYLPGLKPMGN